MRTIALVLGVVATLLLGVIAVELYPIARVAQGVIALGAPSTETAAERRARYNRQADEIEKNFSDRLDAAIRSKTPRKSPPPVPPAAPERD